MNSSKMIVREPFLSTRVTLRIIVTGIIMDILFYQKNHHLHITSFLTTFDISFGQMIRIWIVFFRKKVEFDISIAIRSHHHHHRHHYDLVEVRVKTQGGHHLFAVSSWPLLVRYWALDLGQQLGKWTWTYCWWWWHISLYHIFALPHHIVSKQWQLPQERARTSKKRERCSFLAAVCWRRQWEAC